MTSTWRNTSLGELEAESGGTIQTGPFGSQLHMSDYSATGTPVIMPTNIRNLRIDPAGIARVSDEHVERLARHKVRPGDIVYSRRGDVEKCALITEREAGWLCGTGCLLVRVGGSAADGRFLSYTLALPTTRAWITQHAVGATMANLNTEILREVPVLLPTLEQQREIATALGALDDEIDSRRHTISLIDDLVRTKFESMFNVDEDGSGIPISALVQINPTRRLVKGSSSTYIGMSSLPEFSPVVFDWETKDFGSGQRFTRGDVLMARITPCLENGKTAIVDMLPPGEVGWGSTEYVVLAPQGEISTPWIYSLVRSESIRTWAVRSMTGTSGRQRFQADGFSQYQIAAPDPAGLEDFNQFAIPLFDRMTQLRDSVNMATALRDSLIPELLSGKVRVAEEAVV